MKGRAVQPIKKYQPIGLNSTPKEHRFYPVKTLNGLFGIALKDFGVGDKIEFDHLENTEDIAVKLKDVLIVPVTFKSGIDVLLKSIRNYYDRNTKR